MKIELLPARGWNVRSGFTAGRDTDAADHIKAELAQKGVVSAGGSGVGLQVGLGKDLLSLGAGGKTGTRMVVAAELSGGFLYQNDASSTPLPPVTDAVPRQAAGKFEGSVRVGGSIGIEQVAPELIYWRIDGLGGVDALRGGAPYVGGRITAGATDRTLNAYLQVDTVVSGPLAGDLRVSFGPSFTF